MKKFCAVCGHTLFAESLLTLDNMPRDAQGFFDYRDVLNNCSITLSIMQCGGCGLVQLDAEPVAYYKEVIRASAFSQSMGEFRARQLRAWVNGLPLGRSSKVLEIGCGRGEYLEILENMGVSCHGIEYAQSSVESCRLKGLRADVGYLDGISVPVNIGPFDAFASFNFMEHWPDPNATLSELHKLLKPNAHGLIEVPNFDMILKSGMFSEFIPDHLFYYTEDTLRFTLQKNGFKVISVESLWQDYILSAQVVQREKLNFDNFNNNKLLLIRQLQEFVENHKEKSIAIWGAGHQALAMISMAELSSNITYVVDSAPFKQGKYTPATNLPVVSPEMLISHPVDSIVIMGAGYSDEIYKIIRTKYQYIQNIAILRDHHLEIKTSLNGSI